MKWSIQMGVNQKKNRNETTALPEFTNIEKTTSE